MRPPARRDPPLHLLRGPLPRPRPGERGEPAADRTRPSTSGPLSSRAPCWRRQPSSIASNSAGSGRSGTAPSTSTKAADPAAFGIPDTSTPTIMHQARSGSYQMQSDRMPHPGTRRNRNDRPAGQQRVAITPAQAAPGRASAGAATRRPPPRPGGCTRCNPATPAARSLPRIHHRGARCNNTSCIIVASHAASR